jgi:hypothetical protein
MHKLMLDGRARLDYDEKVIKFSSPLTSDFHSLSRIFLSTEKHEKRQRSEEDDEKRSDGLTERTVKPFEMNH